MRLVTALSVVCLLPACLPGDATPVGVTLDDGQVLIGAITTSDLLLDGAFGPVAIPLDDVGMVLPVEGRTLGDSSGHVTVWLRNGSELRGEWAEPELAMGLWVGDREVEVDVPAERLQALQLQGGEAWPSDGLYRVHTSWGDDFLVDPEQTRIVIENELGTFDPFLTECRSVGPIGDPTGDWRIELDTGTVLIGPLKTDEIAFALPMGPDEIVVPLDSLVGLERGAWMKDVPPKASAFGSFDSIAEDVGSAASAPQRAPARKALEAVPGLSSGDWFSNLDYENAKR